MHCFVITTVQRTDFVMHDSETLGCSRGVSLSIYKFAPHLFTEYGTVDSVAFLVVIGKLCKPRNFRICNLYHILPLFKNFLRRWLSREFVLFHLSENALCSRHGGLVRHFNVAKGRCSNQRANLNASGG